MLSEAAGPVLTVVLGGLVPLAGALAWVAGWVVHGLGRPTAPYLRFTLFALGVGLGSLVQLAIGTIQAGTPWRDPVSAMIVIGVPLGMVIVLAMSGRRRAAGILLAGFALPWTLLLTTYLVDIAQGARWSVPTTIALWLVGLVPLVIGLWLARAGDPALEPDPAAAPGRPGSRRIGSLSRAILRPATYGFPGPGLIVALVTWALVGLLAAGAPLLPIAMAVVAFVLATEVELRWLPPAIRPALEAFHAVGRAEMRRFHQLTGATAPGSLKGFTTWLETTPETPGTRPLRVEVLTALGRFDEAAAELARIEPATPEETFRRASLASDLAWRRGGAADTATLRTLAAALGPHGDPARRLAEGQIAWQEAEVRLAACDPRWPEPLAAYRSQVPDAAGLHARAMRRPQLLSALPLLAVLVLLTLIGLASMPR